MVHFIEVVIASICKFVCLHKRKMCCNVYPTNFFTRFPFGTVHSQNGGSQKLVNTSSLAYFIHFKLKCTV